MMNDVIDLTVDMDATRSASDDESVVPAQRPTQRRLLSVRSLSSEEDDDDTGVVLTTNATETLSMEERHILSSKEEDSTERPFFVV
jgi:hypothetical protein